ncbi:hypothetical protein [Polaribacter cellanae]|uniref:Uncharacterized protein n=1 Tax=Polaribacter cellanae TaxID=2818493 RepID=A0A975CMH3_9FLAO|nr:hypothetical protein [Polaribacter cellanae]QTE21260.1 hypothetical protein J3359_10475 [Polaribacter cellanae]
MGLISIINFNSCKNKEKKETKSSSKKTETIIEKMEDSTKEIENSVKRVTPSAEKKIINTDEKTKYNKFTITENSVNGIQTWNYSFLLNNTAFNTYKVDESKIKPSTKIKKITIRK